MTPDIAKASIAKEEEKLKVLKANLSQYKRGHPAPTSEAILDLAKSIHELSDHLISINRRLEKLEATQEEWTTKGWIDPESARLERSLAHSLGLFGYHDAMVTLGTWQRMINR